MRFGRALSAMAGVFMLFVLPTPGLASTVAMSALQADGAAEPPRHLTLLFFYRLQAFHDMVVRENCLRAFPERTRTLNARYDALRRRVAALVGAAAVEQDSGAGPDESGPNRNCQGSGLLFGYEDKLVTLERHLAGDAR